MKEFFYVVWLVVVYSATAVKLFLSGLFSNISKFFGKATKKLRTCEDTNYVVYIICITILTVTSLIIPISLMKYGILVVIITALFMYLAEEFKLFYSVMFALGALCGLLIFCICIGVDEDRYDSIGVVEYSQEKIYKNNNDKEVMSVDVNGKIKELVIPKECRYTSLEFIVAEHHQSLNVRPDLIQYVLLCNKDKVKAVIDEKAAKRVIKMQPLEETK